MNGRFCIAGAAAGLVAILGAAACTGNPDNAAPHSPSSATPATDVPGEPDPTDADLARFLDNTLPEGASGTMVAARGTELVHCRGFGMADQESGTPADCDTVYDIGSMTKQFTAAAVLKLATQGKVGLDDPITDYFEGVPADKRTITVHQLLTHTAGLAESVGDDYEPLTRDELVTKSLDSKLVSAPGSAYLYSNTGYSLLAAIVEQASGLGYEEFLAEHLFAPAGMTDTGYVLPEWDPERIAVEYDRNGTPHGRPNEHPWADDGPYWNLRGNGGMLSTARDMYRWDVALDGEDVLDRAAKRKLFTPYVREEPGGGTFYGYGWVIARTNEGTVAWHNGGNMWSYGEVTRLLDKDAFLFWITNQTVDKDAGYNLSRTAQELTSGAVQQIL